MASIASAPAPRAPLPSASGANKAFNGKGKPMEVRLSHLVAAKAISDAVRTSLGPRGMDKMVRGLIVRATTFSRVFLITMAPDPNVKGRGVLSWQKVTS